MNVVENHGHETGTVDLRYVLERADFLLDVDLKIPMRGITGIFGDSGSGKKSARSST